MRNEDKLKSTLNFLGNNKRRYLIWNLRDIPMFSSKFDRAIQNIREHLISLLIIMLRLEKYRAIKNFKKRMGHDCRYKFERFIFYDATGSQLLAFKK